MRGYGSTSERGVFNKMGDVGAKNEVMFDKVLSNLFKVVEVSPIHLINLVREFTEFKRLREIKFGDRGRNHKC